MGDLYDHIMRKRLFTFILNTMFSWISKEYEEDGNWHNLDLLTISH